MGVLLGQPGVRPWDASGQNCSGFAKIAQARSVLGLGGRRDVENAAHGERSGVSRE